MTYLFAVHDVEARLDDRLEEVGDRLRRLLHDVRDDGVERLQRTNRWALERRYWKPH